MTLCKPMDYIVHEILQARILKWIAFPFSRGSSQPRDQTLLYQLSHKGSPNWSIVDLQYYVSFMCTAKRFRHKLLQSCLTLCNPVDSSLPGSSVHEILQARVLEWQHYWSRAGSLPLLYIYVCVWVCVWRCVCVSGCVCVCVILFQNLSFITRYWM